jgi:hypothetical protein
MMNSRILATLTLVAMLAFVGSVAQATTVGFVGAAAVNADIPLNYASNVAAGGTGWTVSDGTGATPNIALYWGGGGTGGTGWDWEFHSATTFQHVEALHAGGAWDATNPPTTNAVVQLQDYRPNGALELQFLPAAGYGVKINSFDIGNATDQTSGTFADGPYGFVIDLIRDLDSAIVWTHTTPLWDVEVAGPPRTIREESVAVNYTGAIGQSYTMTFTRYGEGPGGMNIYRTGMDNLSFSQVVPEPTSLALMALCGLGLLARNRR